MDLPKPIACYFEAQNHKDADAAILCFTNDATVFDEGKTMIGTMAIREWNLQALEKYKYTIEPLRLSLEPGKTLVTGRVTGNFPGSPIDLRFIFSLQGDKIASLQIRP